MTKWFFERFSFSESGLGLDITWLLTSNQIDDFLGSTYWQPRIVTRKDSRDTKCWRSCWASTTLPSIRTATLARPGRSSARPRSPSTRSGLILTREGEGHKLSIGGGIIRHMYFHEASSKSHSQLAGGRVIEVIAMIACSGWWRD